jgi:hypothetical protein
MLNIVFALEHIRPEFREEATAASERRFSEQRGRLRACLFAFGPANLLYTIAGRG